jgi:hypothetical protein
MVVFKIAIKFEDGKGWNGKADLHIFFRMIFAVIGWKISGRL